MLRLRARAETKGDAEAEAQAEVKAKPEAKARTEAEVEVEAEPKQKATFRSAPICGSEPWFDLIPTESLGGFSPTRTLNRSIEERFEIALRSLTCTCVLLALAQGLFALPSPNSATPFVILATLDISQAVLQNPFTTHIKPIQINEPSEH